MRRWPAVACLGEVLIDFVAHESELPLQGASTFHRAAGGAPANVAVALSRLETTSAFLGKVGGDAFGRSLRQMLAAEGVDVRGLVEDAHARTALAFVGGDGQAGRMFVFYHAGMADTLLRPEEVNRELIAHASIFHFGSVTLAEEPSAAATRSALEWARQRGCLVSFDPNVRLELWNSPGEARARMLECLRLADVVKVSGEELEFLTGTTDPVQACRWLRECGPSMAVVTLGQNGCYYDAGKSAGHVPGLPVQSVDTLGAGDAFVAGLLAGLSARPGGEVIQDEAALVGTLRFANAVAAMTTTRYGAIPALPVRSQVEHLLESQNTSFMSDDRRQHPAMTQTDVDRRPTRTRPLLPSDYGVPETEDGMVPWSWAVEQLTEARNYWFCTTRPDSRPHTIPAWAVWVDDALYFDGSPKTRRGRNLARNPAISVHLESGDQVVILEGEALEAGKPDPGLAQRLAAAFEAKYGASHAYHPAPSTWDNGGLWRLQPKIAFGWTEFPKAMTRWRF